MRKIKHRRNGEMIEKWKMELSKCKKKNRNKGIKHRKNSQKIYRKM